MNPRAGDIEVASHKGRHGRNIVADLVLVVVCDLGDHRRIHAVQGAAQRGIFHHHRLQRHVSGALADAEERAVHAAGAVEPGCRGIGDRLVEVVMTVPFKVLALHAGIVLQTVDDAGNAARQRDLGIRHAVTHGVAGPDAHRDSRLIRELHQLVDKGHHKAVEVRPCHVFQVAAGHDAGIEGILHGGKVHLHGFPARLLQFLEDVIVAAGDQDAGLPDAQILDRLEVLTAGTDPGGDLRELQPQIPAAFDGLTIFFRIDEELRLADNSIGAAEL